MRDIPGFEGKYSVTEDGRIYSHPKETRGKHGGWLKLFHCGRSRKYLYVSLVIDNKRKNFGVHRLVYLTYIGALDPKLEINHKDKNEANNHYSNLEQITRSANRLHAYGFGKMVVV